MHSQNKTGKQNNSGFTLLEVLVTVIILALLSIPLIRSMGTAATTNNNARILMLSTECAENMMELVEQHTVEELLDLYDVSDENEITINDDGSYTIAIKDADDLPGKLPGGYLVKVELDPNYYPNSNALNVADVKSMSMSDTAVYEMSPLYDSGVYSKFEDWNNAAVDMNPDQYLTAPTDYFKKNLTRIIDINIEKQGEGADADGNTVDQVTVTLDIAYNFNSINKYLRYLPQDQSEYIEETQEIFNNLSSNVPLAGIYLFYQPRSIATQYGNRDIINVHNYDNVKANLFIAAQKGDGNITSDAIYYSALTGPVVTVEEIQEGNLDDAALTLFTNLCETAPYSENDASDAEILCQLTYKNPDNGAEKTGNDASLALGGRNLDGKTLNRGNTKNRIYKVITQVFNGNNEKIVELDGTKLE